jgi:hypothetical protein
MIEVYATLAKTSPLGLPPFLWALLGQKASPKGRALWGDRPHSKEDKGIGNLPGDQRLCQTDVLLRMQNFSLFCIVL